MNHRKARKGRGEGGPQTAKKIALSPFARKAISLLRKTPVSKTAFTLSITSEETPHRITVIDRGRGADSSFHIHLSPTRSVPKWLPPTSTYVVATQPELDSVLAAFAEFPDLYSKPKGDALDEPGLVSYDESEDPEEDPYLP